MNRPYQISYFYNNESSIINEYYPSWKNRYTSRNITRQPFNPLFHHLPTTLIPSSLSPAYHPTVIASPFTIHIQQCGWVLPCTEGCSF